MIKRLSIQLPESVIKRLDFSSKAFGISKSQFVTLIIAKYYNIIDFCEYDYEVEEWFNSRERDIEIGLKEWSKNNG